jgi:elongation factor P
MKAKKKNQKIRRKILFSLLFLMVGLLTLFFIWTKQVKVADQAEEADVEKRKANYLYKDESFAYFMDNETYDQFNLPLDQLGGKEKFMKDGVDVTVMHFDSRPMSVELPIKVELTVTSAPPGVRGNSAGNVMKTAELETGALISVPMFVESGDVIRINTDSEEYVERA